ncbi:MAG TPA: Slp family lipoprotein [Nitrospiraceae bacterium]|nr:Slp family lipoprotein [Nitrospiraceae bacterium]
MKRHACVALVVLMVLSGCSRYHIIPNQLEKQGRKNGTFEQIKAASAAQKGALVVLGGDVLSTKRLEEKTCIELLSTC